MEDIIYQKFLSFILSTDANKWRISRSPREELENKPGTFKTVTKYISSTYSDLNFELGYISDLNNTLQYVYCYCKSISFSPIYTGKEEEFDPIIEWMQPVLNQRYEERLKSSQQERERIFNAKVDKLTTLINKYK